MPGRLYANRVIDFNRVTSVGFDLDHTLATYHDDRVNALACEETLLRLVSHHAFPESILDIRYDGAATARGLVIDLADRAVLKLDRQRRVRRARVDGEWMSPEAIDHRYGSAQIDQTRVHPIHSQFDLPTAFLFDAIGSVYRVLGQSIDARELCQHVRTALDYTHTRGNLKRRIMTDIGAFLFPLPRTDMLRALRDSGRSLFVLTNSGREYTVAVLDYLFAASGNLPRWEDLFDAVVVDAGKPGYFGSADGTGHTSWPGGVMVDGGNADALETRLASRGSAVLYVGDHATSDIEAARRGNWQTVQVVPEMAEFHNGGETGDWGSAFSERDHATWFARLVADGADGVVEHVDHLLTSEAKLDSYCLRPPF